MDDGNRSLVEQIFHDAQFVRSLGIELTSFGTGWCETKIVVSPALQQQHGFIHAGVLMTLADPHMRRGGCLHRTRGTRRDHGGEQDFLSTPSLHPVLICRAEVLRAGKTLIFVEAEVLVERKEGRVLVAKASSTLAVIPLNPDRQVAK